jgi:hypothetical protein
MADNPTMATYRWSSDRSEDRFTVENPATGDTITSSRAGHLGFPSAGSRGRRELRAAAQDRRL